MTDLVGEVILSHFLVGFQEADFMKSLFVFLLVGLIRVYQLAVRPFLGDRCRFHPSCSEYAVQALGRYGALFGIVISVKRICRCHPWCDGGYDPVP